MRLRRLSLARLAALPLACIACIASSAGAAGAGAAGITMDGRALGADGRGITRARVELRPVLSRQEQEVREAEGRGEPPPEVTAVTREGGRFTLTAPEAGMWTVTVRAAGYVPVRMSLLPLLEPVSLPDAELRRDAGLRVRVEAADGRTAVGARVRAEAVPRHVPQDLWPPDLPTPWEPLPRRAVTGADGEVHLPRAADEELRVWAAAKGYAVTEAEPFSLGKGPGVRARLRRAARGGPRPSRANTALPRAGHIFDADRHPIAGAWIWPAGDPALAVRSDIRGAYRLEGAALAALSDPDGGLSGAAAGFLPAVLKRPQGLHGDLPALLLSPAGSVTGTVVDGEGRPLPEARIEAAALDDFVAFTTRAPQAWAAADGSFRLSGLTVGTAYRIDVHRPGFAPRSFGLGTLARTAAAVTGLRVVLRRGAGAFGTVVDEAGRPAAGAEVELVCDPGQRNPSQSLRRATVGTDGHFSLPDLSPGPGELIVRRPGSALFRRAGIEIPEAGAVDLGRLVIPGGKTLTGRVTDPAGAPLADVEVWMVSGDPTGSTWGSRPITRTALDGTFTVNGLAPGAGAVLDLCHASSLPEVVQLNSLPPEPLAVTLRPAGLLAGTVEGPDGAPVPGALVYARRTGSLPDPGLRACATGNKVITTDGEGRFSLPPAEPGWYTVFAQGKGFRRGRIDRLEVRGGPGSPLRFVLAPGAALSGRVVDPAGTPLYDATVETARNGSGVMTRTDTAGRYRLEGLDTGGATVEVESTSGRAEQSIEIVPGENVLDFTVKPAPPGPAEHEVHGHVVEPGGEPVSGAVVSSYGTRAVTALDGSFRISLQAGTHKLWARSAGYPLGGSILVQVQAERDLGDVEIRFEPPAELKGRITGIAPDETAWVRVVASSYDHDVPIAGRVSADGSYRLAPLVSGDWEISVRAESRTASARIHIEPGEREAAADLELRPLSPVSGRVAGPGGEPLAQGTQVDLRFTPVVGDAFSAITRGGGSFDARLTDGTYAVYARRRGTAQESLPVPLVVAGAAVDGLEIRLPPTAELHGRILGLAPGQIPVIQIQDPEFRSGTVNADGTYRLAGLRPGTWRVKVRLEAESGNAPRTIFADVTVRGGDTRLEDIEMDLTFPPEDAP